LKYKLKIEKMKKKEMVIQIELVIPKDFKLTEEEMLPNYATIGSVGLDLRAVTLKEIYNGTKQLNEGIIEKASQKDFFVLRGGERALVGTGVKMAIPEGHELQIRSRSGLALKKGLIVANSPGCVDPDYRGEICVILLNATDFTIKTYYGDRIAQAVLSPIVKVTTWDVVEKLPETIRGEKGFGSTGK